MASITDSLAAKLQLLASNNRNFAYIIRHLGQKKRRTPLSDIDRVKYNIVNGGYQISIDETLDVFNELHKLGIGKLIKSQRAGVHSKFEWKCPIREVAEVALGQDPSKAKLPTDRTNVAPAITSVKPSQTLTIDLYAPLRGRLVHLQLPSDFAPQDAKELSNWLEQLAASRSS